MTEYDNPNLDGSSNSEDHIDQLSTPSGSEEKPKSPIDLLLAPDQLIEILKINGLTAEQNELIKSITELANSQWGTNYPTSVVEGLLSVGYNDGQASWYRNTVSKANLEMLIRTGKAVDTLLERARIKGRYLKALEYKEELKGPYVNVQDIMGILPEDFQDRAKWTPVKLELLRDKYKRNPYDTGLIPLLQSAWEENYILTSAANVQEDETKEKPLKPKHQYTVINGEYIPQFPESGFTPVDKQPQSIFSEALQQRVQFRSKPDYRNGKITFEIFYSGKYTPTIDGDGGDVGSFIGFSSSPITYKAREVGYEIILSALETSLRDEDSPLTF